MCIHVTPEARRLLCWSRKWTGKSNKEEEFTVGEGDKEEECMSDLHCARRENGVRWTAQTSIGVEGWQ